MVLCNEFFEAKPLDLLVFLNSVHDDFSINALQVRLIVGLLMPRGLFGLKTT